MWSSPNALAPDILKFIAQSGINVPGENLKPMNFLPSFTTEKLLKEMIWQKNLYGEQFMASKPSFFSVWAKIHRSTSKRLYANVLLWMVCIS